MSFFEAGPIGAIGYPRRIFHSLCHQPLVPARCRAVFLWAGCTYMLSSSRRKSKIEIGAASLYQELGLLELLLVEGVPILFRVSLKHSFARPVVLSSNIRRGTWVCCGGMMWKSIWSQVMRRQWEIVNFLGNKEHCEWFPRSPRLIASRVEWALWNKTMNTKQE